MKKIIALLSLSIVIFACSSKKEGNMIVQGQIKGLKKGTLYLQKLKDTALISVDSITLYADENFVLTDNVDSPVAYYLTFKGNTSDKKILFFGEKGTINIVDKLEYFGFNPKITGSKNQEIFDQYNKVNKRFKNQNLDFIKRNFDYNQKQYTDSLLLLEKEYQRFIKRKILYTTNFALNNTDFEVAPYLALTQLQNASLKLLDTINNTLSDNVKNSFYGKELNAYISDIKKKQQ
jgi:hypothetical protein